MSFIDVAIPAIIGIVVLLWPKVLFVGSRAAPTEQKLRWIRYAGIALLFVAALYLVIKLVAR
jgi:hypothetical protein